MKYLSQFFWKQNLRKCLIVNYRTSFQTKQIRLNQINTFRRFGGNGIGHRWSYCTFNTKDCRALEPNDFSYQKKKRILKVKPIK